MAAVKPPGEKAQSDCRPGIGSPHELQRLGSMGEGMTDFVPLLQQSGHSEHLLNGNRIIQELGRGQGTREAQTEATVCRVPVAVTVNRR